MKPIWWTCGCGLKQLSYGFGTPVCKGCEKPAGFSIDPPKEQAGLDFGQTCRGDEDAAR